MDPAIVENLDREVLADVYTSDEALLQLDTLCERFGGRYAGSEGNRAAGEYLAAQLKAYGLSNVQLQPFPHHAWQRGTCSLSLTVPQERTFAQREVISLPHTGSVHLEGPVVFIGHGTPSEFDAYADQIQGRIVMVTARNPAYHRRPLHRRQKIRRAVELGAAAMLYMRDVGGRLPETGATATNRESPLPVIGISQEVGGVIRRLLRQGEVRVRIETENSFHDTTMYNVVADIPGSSLAHKVVLTGAHYDGHDVGHAANDNGAGTVVGLETARTLARHGGYAKTLRFVFFNGEEIGHLGSKAYVQEHPMDAVEFMINLDGAGRVGVEGLGLQNRPELIPYFRAMAAEMKHPMVVDCADSFSSDHQPFVDAGVPAVILQNMTHDTGVRGFYHTAADTVDKVKLGVLQRATAQVARILLRLATRDDFPAKRKHSEGKG